MTALPWYCKKFEFIRHNTTNVTEINAMVKYERMIHYIWQIHCHQI